jgi:adenylate kinase
MIISISGTPGTGKTIVAKMLAKKLGANLIIINDLVGKKIPYKVDKKRKTKIIDKRDLRKAVKKELLAGANIIEGHMTHFIVSDYVFVLRAIPNVLKVRLKARKWPESKIKENVEAEVLDEITMEAMKVNKKVFEIDTSKTSPKKTVGVILKILNNQNRNKYIPGKIDWTKKYLTYLTK